LPHAQCGAGRVGQELDCLFVGQGVKPEKPALFSLPPGPADAARKPQFARRAMVPANKRPARHQGRTGKIGLLMPEDDGFEECGNPAPRPKHQSGKIGSLTCLGLEPSL